MSTPRRSISSSRSSMKRWHSARRACRSCSGTTFSRTKYPSSRNRRTCMAVSAGSELLTSAPIRFSRYATLRTTASASEGSTVFSSDRDYLSFLAMIDDLKLLVGLDGRAVRHAAGDIRVRAHRHAELEVNLVVRGTASYLLDSRRYE